MIRTIPSWVALALACVALAGAASARAADRVVLAAGDIACDPLDPNFMAGTGTATACRQQATADLMVDGSFDAVLALGDLQYDAGTLSNFQQSYGPSWGRVKAATRPVIGNHEGITADTGAGYCVYFGAAAHCANRRQGGAAFYSFDVGDWHVVVLNSNCVAAGGCDVGSPQYQWLQNDLAANPGACTLAAWHHPRWSSGHEGSNAFMQPIWQLLWVNGADLVLSGHSHDYERFAPIDAAGAINAADGMRSFVVGTGGVNLLGLGAPAPGSEVRQNTTFGVLRLGLHPTSYDWRFLPASGSTFTDSGAQFCRGFSSGGDVQPPSAPSGVTATQTSPTRVDVSWTRSTDNVGVTGYEVWRGTETGAPARVATTRASATTYADRTVARGQSYRYQLRARDAAGNVSAPSEAVWATPPVTTPPVTAPPLVGPPGEVASPHATSASNLLARWRLRPLVARRALARGWVRIPRRRWAPTIIRVRVDGRLAARRRVATQRALRVRLAAWAAGPRYRRSTITVTIRSPR